MNRLLMAAARGARIQFFAESYRYEWVDIDRVPLFEVRQGYYRIHPDDEHLQYGPVSTALREYAETGKEPETLTGLMAREAFVYEYESPLHVIDWLDTSLFALILAEALAEEGL